MDLDQLQSVRDRERQTDRLQQLRESFYEEAADFVADLRAERDAAADEAEDPFDSPQVNRLTDRIRTAEQTLEAIYEKRVGKVVKAATFAAADLPAEADGMTKEEADLFETLVEEIEANRARVLDRLTGDHAGAHGSPSESPTSSESDDDASESSVGAAALMGNEGTDATPREPPEPPSEPSAPPDASAADEPGDATPDDADAGDGSDPEAEDGHPADQDAAGSGPTDDAEAPAVDRQLVRITDDVGPILGVDEREYDLAAEDVVTLPAPNAEPLVERGAAERLE